MAHSLVLIAVFTFSTLHYEVLAQSKRVGADKSPLCTSDNAVEMIKQQIDASKTFNKTIQRINVLIRAADLLWPHQPEKARVTFVDAFDLATEHEKENEQNAPRAVILRLQVPDQRYIVIRAVAKRDAAWAKELTKQMLDREKDDRGSSADQFRDQLAAERLLQAAHEMIATDVNAALDLARVSLNYPATSALIRFLYRFAQLNQPAADQFYAQALAVYGGKPMREFLYLQAYPFAWHETLNTPFVPNYQVPVKFVTNESLQRRFMEVMLRRAQQAVEGPIDESDAYRSATVDLLPGKVHLLNGLIRLEPQIRTALPDLTPALIEAREKILVSLSVETQKLLVQPGREVSTTPDKTFDEQIEAALKLPDLDERDEMIATAIFGSEKETLTGAIQAIDKVSNSNLRSHLFEWFYFHRAITAIKEKRFEDAERLISRVEGHEQRAFLYSEMAKELLKGPETRTYAAQILDDAIAEAKKAGTTTFAARTLLTASSLYAKLDLSRSIGILGDAINQINRIEAADFSSDGQALEKKPQRRGRGGAYRGEYAFRFYMPGLDPESAFREMAKIDFDTSLSQSSALTDKFQRAMSTLALAQVCLQQIQERPKSRKSAKP